MGGFCNDFAQKRPKAFQLIVVWLCYMASDIFNIASGNGLMPVRRQAITWTIADLLKIEPRETNYGEILIKLQRCWLKKTCMNFLSAILSMPQCVNMLPSLSELTLYVLNFSEGT